LGHQMVPALADSGHAVADLNAKAKRSECGTHR